jgi:hypothetical protein
MAKKVKKDKKKVGQILTMEELLKSEGVEKLGLKKVRKLRVKLHQ